MVFLSYLIGMWFGEDQRANNKKTTCLKEVKLHLYNYSKFHSEHDWEDLCRVEAPITDDLKEILCHNWRSMRRSKICRKIEIGKTIIFR